MIFFSEEIAEDEKKNQAKDIKRKRKNETRDEIYIKQKTERERERGRQLHRAWYI